MYIETKPKKETDLLNMRFGSLTVASLARGIKTKDQIWLCTCDCGKTRLILRDRLTKGQATSCGCAVPQAPKRTTPAKPQAPDLYSIWSGIKKRISDPKSPKYRNYGGRGITLYEAWQEDFLAFKEYILREIGEKPAGHTLDRIDNNWNYEPGNLRWASRGTQARNQRRNVWVWHNGKAICQADLARKLGVPYATVAKRLKAGKLIRMDIEGDNNGN